MKILLNLPLHFKASIRIIIAFMVILLLTAQSYAEQEIVILGDDTNEPYIFLDNNGKPQGIVVEILKHVSKVSEYTFIYKLSPWKRAFMMLEGGEGVLVGVSKTTDRLAIFDYSEELYSHSVRLITLKGSKFPFNSIADLKGKNVAFQLGSRYTDEFSKALDNQLFMQSPTNRSVQRLKMLLNNRVDVALIGAGQTGLNLNIAKDPELIRNRHKFVALPKPLLQDANYIAASKKLNYTSFLAALNGIIKQSRKSGEYKKIVSAYAQRMTRK